MGVAQHYLVRGRSVLKWMCYKPGLLLSDTYIKVTRNPAPELLSNNNTRTSTGSSGALVGLQDNQ